MALAQRPSGISSAAKASILLFPTNNLINMKSAIDIKSGLPSGKQEKK
jgi:hypothetical protein